MKMKKKIVKLKWFFGQEFCVLVLCSLYLLILRTIGWIIFIKLHSLFCARMYTIHCIGIVCMCKSLEYKKSVLIQIWFHPIALTAHLPFVVNRELIINALNFKDNEHKSQETNLPSNVKFANVLIIHIIIRGHP